MEEERGSLGGGGGNGVRAFSRLELAGRGGIRPCQLGSDQPLTGMTRLGLSQSDGVLREAGNQGGDRQRPKGGQVVARRKAEGRRSVPVSGKPLPGAKLPAARGQRARKCSASRLRFPPSRSPKSGAGSCQGLGQRRKRCTCQDSQPSVGHAGPGDQRAAGGCGEARHGVLALGGHPPSGAFLHLGRILGAAGRVQPGVGNRPSSVALCRDSDVE